MDLDMRPDTEIPTRLPWGSSPLSPVQGSISVPAMRAEGRVRYLTVSGERDSGAWGVIGSFWLSTDGERGGFLVSPLAVWQGSEMVRSYRSSLERGWTHERVFRYWQSRVGVKGENLQVERQQRADSLLLLHKMIQAA